MDFIDILNQFHINFNEVSNSLNDQIAPLFNFKDSILLSYHNAKSLIDKTNDSIKAYNDKIVEYVNNHKITVDSLSKDVSTFRTKSLVSLDDEVSRLTKEFNDKKRSNEQTKKENENKIFREEVRIRSLINDEDIKKNLANNELKKQIEPFYDKYNYTKDEFLSFKKEENNLIHASTSKNLYKYQDSYHSLKEYARKNDEEFANLKLAIDQKFTENNTEYALKKYQHVLEYNTKIRELSKNRDKRESVLVQIEQDKLSLIQKATSELALLEDKKDSFLATFEVKMKKIDLKKKILAKSYEKKRDLFLHNNLPVLFKLEQDLNKTIEKNLALEFEVSKHLKRQLRKTNLAKYRVYKYHQEKMMRFLAKLELEYKKDLEKLSLEEEYLIIEKSKIIESIYPIDKETFDYKYDLDLNSNAKKYLTFTKRMDNKNSINIYLEEANFDKEKLEQELEFKKMELDYELEKAKLAYEIEVKKAEALGNDEFNKITIEYEKNKEQLKKKENDIVSLLNIEKNKYLASFNEEQVLHQINLNNIAFNLIKDSYNSDLESFTNLINEENTHNNALLSNNKELNELLIILKRHQFGHELDLKRLERDYAADKSKNDLQLNKLEADIALMKIIAKNSYDIFDLYLQNYLALLDKVLNQLSLSLSNAEKIVKQLTIFHQLFLELLQNITAIFAENMTKIIDSRINFDYGSKYDTLLSEEEDAYNDGLKQLSSRHESLSETIHNYSTTILRKQKALNELIKAQRSPSVDKNKAKELKKEIKATKTLIAKTKTSRNLLIERAKEIPLLEKNLKADYELKVNKWKTKKQLEAEVSYEAINYFKQYPLQLDEQKLILIKLLDFQHIVIFKTFKRNINEIRHILSNLKNHYKSIVHYIDKYSKNELDNLNRINKRINLKFKNRLEDLNENYSEKQKEIQNDIDKNMLGHSDLEFSFQLKKRELELDLSHKKSIINAKNERDILFENKNFKNIKKKFKIDIYALEDNIRQMRLQTIKNLALNETFNKTGTEKQLNIYQAKKNEAKAIYDEVYNRVTYKKYQLDYLYKKQISKNNGLYDLEIKRLKNNSKLLKNEAEQENRDNNFQFEVHKSKVEKEKRRIERHFEHQKRVVKHQHIKTNRFNQFQILKKYKIKLSLFKTIK